MRVCRFGCVLLLLMVAGVGCRRQAAQAPEKGEAARALPVPPPSLPATPAADKPAAPGKQADKPADEASQDVGEPPKSWSDPRVLAELVKSCAFEPDSMSEEARKAWTGEHEEGEGDSVISCNASMEQSCVYDPCYDEQGEKCNPRCVNKCKSCGKSCASQCETCKAPCQDDACRMACAKKCASCHESCVRKRDRCATGTCTEEYKKCRVKLRDEWAQNGCAAICSTYTDCKSACREKNETAKRQKDCDKACPYPKGAGKCNMQLCQGDDGMGINPEDLN